MLLLLVVSEELTQYRLVPKEIVRKVLHMLIGFEYLVLYHFFGASWQIVVIPATFVVFNTLLFRFKWFETMDRGKGEHAGVIYYAVSITALSFVTACLPQFLYPFGVGVFCLSFGDCAAALMGRYLRPRIRIMGDKTLWGMVGCYVFSFAAQLLLAWILRFSIDWGAVAVLSAVACLCEVSIGKGLDNIAVPVWCALFAYGFYFQPHLLPLFALVFAGYLLFAVTYTAKAFTLPAAILAGLMLIAVGDLGGWGAFTLILSSYAVVFVIDKICGVINTKRTGERRFHRARSVAQIWQNGLPAFACLVLFYFSPYPAFILGFGVAVGESMVDSIASAVGSLSTKPPVDIISHRKVYPTKSGGITLLGTLGGCIASLLVPLIVGAFGGYDWTLILVFVWQIGGMLLDSVLGSLLQVRYRCAVCSEIVDSPIHCGRPGERIGGISWMTNGNVNLFTNSITTASLVGLLLVVALIN